jgi:hypothetical protein
MYKKLWKSTHQAVCRISFYDVNQISLASCTGFKTGEYIVSDEIVLNNHRAWEAELLFVGADSCTPSKKLRIPISEFRKKILPRPKSMYNHLVLMKADYPALDEIKGLNLSGEQPQPGQSVAVLAYQLEQSNLSIKQGILSSVCLQHGRPYLQFEVSVKQGNSGAPLIHAECGEVIGVVGYRLAELSRTYQRIRDVVDENVEVLETVLDKWKIADIDPMQVLIANQKLIRYFAREIYKSANVRIGYATPVSEIVQYIHKVNSRTRQLIE